MICLAGLEDASLVILAAGMGSRFGGLKQVEPVGPHGELLIEYSIFDALAAGFEHVLFVIQRHQENTFRKAFGDKLERRCRTSFVHQELTDLPEGWRAPKERTKPWGTGHAVLACRDVVRGPIAVINADDYYGRDSYAKIAAAIREGSVGPGEFCLIGFDLLSTLTTRGPVSRGICSVDEAGFLMSIRERSSVTLQDGGATFLDQAGETHRIHGEAIASMNMWAFPNSFLQLLGERFSQFLESARSDLIDGEYFLPHVVGDLIDAGRTRVRVLRTDSTWMGVTYRDDAHEVKARIRQLIEEGQYPDTLW